jgi:hypothetical protein
VFLEKGILIGAFKELIEDSFRRKVSGFEAATEGDYQLAVDIVSGSDKG